MVANDAGIIQHFPGWYKPWHRFRVSVIHRGLGVYLRYQKARSRLKVLLGQDLF